MSATDFIQKAIDLRKSGRFEEALIAARHAVSLDSSNANAFWQKAHCLIRLNDEVGAADALKKVTELAPDFAQGWSQLGLALLELDPDKAQECFERALELDRNDIDALVKLAPIYEEDKRASDEQRVLLALERNVDLTAYQLNRLGILYLNQNHFYEAIAYFRRVAIASNGPAGFFNLGLTLSKPEISQRVDAIDAWRRALKREPGYQKASTSISELLPELLDLRRRHKTNGAPILDQRHWYACYVNPLELLQLSQDEALESLNPKSVQRARKALLQEIELEEGRISWMPGLVIDRSRAIAICEDLNNARITRFHQYVRLNPSLLAFLQTGSLDHFLVDEATSPIEFIERLEDDKDGFSSWLSVCFSAQYDLTMSAAIEKQSILAVECLLAGRRWVRPEDEDKCFEGAHRQVERLLAPLRQAAKTAETAKPTLQEVKAILSEGHLGNLLSLLPAAFYGEQQEAAGLIRMTSLSAYNNHADPDLAKAVLELSRPFATHSPALQHRISEDLATLNDRIREERQDEAHLRFGNRACAITKEGVRFGDSFIPVGDVLSLRGGMIATSHNPLTIKFTIVVGSTKGGEITIEWSASKEHDVQREFFSKLMNAVHTYLLPQVISEIRKDLDDDQRVQIGPIRLTKSGVELESKGWFSSKSVHCPWTRLQTSISNGAVDVVDPADPKTKVSLPLYTVDNAIALHLMAQIA